MHTNKRRRRSSQIHANLRVGFKGFFTVELIEAATGRVKRHLEFENLITDAGLDALAATPFSTLLAGNGTLAYMGVGTNATAPANADVALGAEIAPANTNRSNSNGGIAEVVGAGAAFAYWYRKLTWNFLEAQAIGNLAELGIFSALTGGTMFCRQLFKDVGGTPTVIVKTAADQLRITYEFRIYWPADATVNPLVISGANYSVTTRAINIDDSRTWGGTDGFSLDAGFHGGCYNAVGSWKAWDTQALIAQTGANMAGASTVASSVALAAYVPGTFYRDYTLKWEPGVANPVGGIGSISVLPSGFGGEQFQMAFTPKLPKDNTKRLTLVLRISWGRGP